MMLTIRKYTLVALLLPALTTIASAQVVSLDSILNMIDRNNPMLEEYENKAKAFDAYAAGAKSWMAPMVGAGTFMTPYPNQMLMEEGDKGAWMFSIEQEIPNPAKLKAKRRYMESRSDVEEQNRSIQFNALRAEAKALYYQWLVAEEKTDILTENARNLDLMFKLSRSRSPYNQGSL